MNTVDKGIQHLCDPGCGCCDHGVTAFWSGQWEARWLCTFNLSTKVIVINRAALPCRQVPIIHHKPINLGVFIVFHLAVLHILSATTALTCVKLYCGGHLCSVVHML